MRSTHPVQFLCMAAFVTTLAGCATTQQGTGGKTARAPMPMMAAADSGFVFRPHDSVMNQGTVKLQVTNKQKTDAAHAVQWRYRRGTDDWSEAQEQGATVDGLLQGDSYQVKFKMKSPTSPHRAPGKEPVDLSDTEKETLNVRWR